MSLMQARAHSLGGEVVGPNQILCPAPGHSERDRSFSVLFRADDSFIVNPFAPGESWKDAKAYVAHKLGLGDGKTDKPALRTPQSHHTKSEDRSQLPLQVWGKARPISGSLGETYLASRSLSLSADVIRSDAIRFLHDCLFRLQDGSLIRLPATVALMRDVFSNKPCAIQRTALKPDGKGKADVPGLGPAKRMLGAASGAVIKLIADEDVENGLALAEGIETGLSAVCVSTKPPGNA
jgi:hypothetical protein